MHATVESKCHFMSVFGMLFMIRTRQQTAVNHWECPEKSCLDQSNYLWRFWSLWSFNCMFRAWGTYGGQSAHSTLHCSAVSSVWGGAMVSGIGAALWCFKEYSFESLFKWFLTTSCSTALMKPVSMVLNVMKFMHSATIIKAHISISADERSKPDGISNVTVVTFPNIVLWMVVWCFTRDADTFRGSGSIPIPNTIMLQSLISAAPKWIKVLQYIIFRSNGFQGSRDQSDQGKCWSCLRLGLTQKNLWSPLSLFRLAIKPITSSVIQSVQLTRSKCWNQDLNCWNNSSASASIEGGFMLTAIGRIQFCCFSYGRKLL